MVTGREPQVYRFAHFLGACFHAESTTLNISIACLGTNRRVQTVLWFIITTWEVSLQRYHYNDYHYF